jgi:hypothetical protein
MIPPGAVPIRTVGNDSYRLQIWSNPIRKSKRTLCRITMSAYRTRASAPIFAGRRATSLRCDPTSRAVLFHELFGLPEGESASSTPIEGASF